MKLETKPDFEEVKQRWRAYWAGEVCGRPLVVASVRRNGAAAMGAGEGRYRNALGGAYAAELARNEACVAGTRYLAEGLPFFSPDHGPDQFAAFLGARLEFAEQGSDHTNWVTPMVDDWSEFLPLAVDPGGATYRSVLDYARMLGEHARGRYLVGICDFHSNADALLAIRGAERLCMDFYDCPDLVAEAMRQVRALYEPVYNAIYEAAGIGEETGSIGWAPFWSDGKFATIQCDFICMVSPEIARKYILPALEEEAAFLDRCVYHLDGPGALVHLDDILAIEDIDVIQWVSGAGQPAMHTWLDVLKKCQAAGKGLQIMGVGLDAIKGLHRELSPQGVVYCVNAKTEQEVEEICRWLEANT